MNKKKMPTWPHPLRADRRDGLVVDPTRPGIVATPSRS